MQRAFCGLPDTAIEMSKRPAAADLGSLPRPVRRLKVYGPQGNRLQCSENRIDRRDLPHAVCLDRAQGPWGLVTR